ncbi:MAG: hypothetical protein RR014_05030 [Bilophila sp.]
MKKPDRTRLSTALQELASTSNSGARRYVLDVLEETHAEAVESMETSDTQADIWRAQGVARVVRALIHKIVPKQN